MAPDEAAMSRATCPPWPSLAALQIWEPGVMLPFESWDPRSTSLPPTVRPIGSLSGTPLSFNCSLCLRSTFVARAPRRDSCTSLCPRLARLPGQLPNRVGEHAEPHASHQESLVLFSKSRNKTCSTELANALSLACWQLA
ncbi:hypothetical protein SVAN01_02911 [Stagonosporopsis vannaccii]|nr:hypothetical protein SVAN01_02911 [Stagonosporopsis vannaccii]